MVNIFHKITQTRCYNYNSEPPEINFTQIVNCPQIKLSHYQLRGHNNNPSVVFGELLRFLPVNGKARFRMNLCALSAAFNRSRLFSSIQTYSTHEAATTQLNRPLSTLFFRWMRLCGVSFLDLDDFMQVSLSPPFVYFNVQRRCTGFFFFFIGLLNINREVISSVRRSPLFSTHITAHST